MLGNGGAGKALVGQSGSRWWKDGEWIQATKKVAALGYAAGIRPRFDPSSDLLESDLGSRVCATCGTMIT